MTKEDAIRIISGYETNGCGYCLQGGEEVEEALRLAVDALKQEPKWVPVSERLPEELETVLITFTRNGGRYVTADRYRYISTFKDPIDWINTSQYMGTQKVIAWMPLPKPYEGGEE